MVTLVRKWSKSEMSGVIKSLHAKGSMATKSQDEVVSDHDKFVIKKG